jgi:hypothetical protein
VKAKTLTKAKLRCLDNESWSFEFPFNPEAGSMKLSRGVSWSADGNGYDPWGGPLDYEHGEPDSLSFTILLDESSPAEPDLADATAFEAALLSAISSLLPPDENSDSVLPRIEKLWRLTVPVKPSGHGTDSFDVRPPVVAFVWDAFVFVGAIVDLDAEFLLMDHSGKARRAQVDVALKGRAFAASTSLAQFLDAAYEPPTASGTGSATGGSREDLLAMLT